jgi:hypothetical protein
LAGDMLGVFNLSMKVSWSHRFRVLQLELELEIFRNSSTVADHNEGMHRLPSQCLPTACGNVRTTTLLAMKLYGEVGWRGKFWDRPQRPEVEH